LAVVLAILAVVTACRKGEKGAAPSGTAKEQAATPVPRPEKPPAIRETAEPGLAPYSGLDSPRDAAVDDRGRLWVADLKNARLAIFDPAGGYLGGWGQTGGGKYSFRELSGVAIQGDRLYVADSWNGRIQAYTVSGEWKASVTGLYAPHGVCVAPDGKVWATDTANHRLMVYDADLHEPAQVIGKEGARPGEFSFPIGIAAGPSGSVYVADRGNKRIEVFDSKGSLKKVWALPMGGDSLPYLEVDGKETLYVTDSIGNAVVSLDANGKELNRWTTDEAGHKLVWPSGIALDQKNKLLYVVNTGNSTISLLRLPGKR
jgi:DNA-binding beta-propeller fold protein YncE